MTPSTLRPTVGLSALTIAIASAVRMLRRKSTRISLKPEDRDEYFAHKKEAKQQRSEQAEQKDKPSEKELRLGIVVKPR